MSGHLSKLYTYYILWFKVVHITSFPRDKPVTNLTEISVEALGKRMKEEAEKRKLFSILSKKLL